YGKLSKLPAPVIVRLVKDDFKHFVVYRGEVDGLVFVADPIRGNVRLPRSHFERQWDGHVLAVVRRGMNPRATHPLELPADHVAPRKNQAARGSLSESLQPPRPVR